GINVYLNKSSKPSVLLGSAAANVKEFLPDRLRIQAHLSQERERGWINPKSVAASVALANLYGTPATDRRITARLELRPEKFRFAEFRDYIFFDRLADDREARHEQTVDLGEKKT